MHVGSGGKLAIILEKWNRCREPTQGFRSEMIALGGSVVTKPMPNIQQNRNLPAKRLGDAVASSAI